MAPARKITHSILVQTRDAEDWFAGTAEWSAMMAAGGANVIAVVDDDDAVRESLAFLLTVSGHAVAVYASAADFLAHCDLGDVAGLILDHHMPQQTGLELLARLREDGRNLPVLLVTGSPSPEIVARAGALGVDRVLEKPVSDAGLMEFVERVAA
jgi:two-component system, LuxR family, response regulator FixJ